MRNKPVRRPSYYVLASDGRTVLSAHHTQAEAAKAMGVSMLSAHRALHKRGMCAKKYYIERAGAGPEHFRCPGCCRWFDVRMDVGGACPACFRERSRLQRKRSVNGRRKANQGDSGS